MCIETPDNCVQPLSRRCGLVDLHVHLRGTLDREAALVLAERNDVVLPPATLREPGYGWHDFSSFLDAYDIVTSVIQTADDLEQVALRYLRRCAEAGGVYVEFMLSPPDLARTGVPFNDQLKAIEAAAQQAAETCNIHCRLIATAVRHLGPEAAILAARMATSIKSDLLVGFGLTGDENRFSASAFADAFDIARQEGLRATAHAGEHRPADTIIEAIEALGLDRVGHGIRAVESPEVLRQLAETGIPLEVCMSSNFALGLYDGIGSHPIGKLADAGCAVVLGTDDPGFFLTDLAVEYDLALSAAPTLTRARTSLRAIDAAFCGDALKDMLRAGVPAA